VTTLNHLNLAVSNVQELTRFFETGFGFRLAEQRGQGKFSLLLGEDGFVLAIMHDKNAGAKPYPGFFHVGFQVASVEEVREHYEHLVQAGFEPPKPALLERGGPKTYGFYCPAPGGVLVEVSARAA
jgi:catechol 2,3-dioxygenase-like lactoylglutathione lyase family enzyme